MQADNGEDVIEAGEDVQRRQPLDRRGVQEVVLQCRCLTPIKLPRLLGLLHPDWFHAQVAHTH
nr:hypothetical protein Iba_chr04cCG10600 [Ipomoea batatas]